MRKIFIIFCVVYATTCFSQEAPNIKFGKISVADLERKIYDIDSSAEAVVISDIGSTQIKGNKKGQFSLEFKRHRRIHILKKSGYDHATVEIILYADGDEEEVLDDLKAVTYNSEDGKVVTAKLDPKTAVFRDKIDKNKVVKKFTFPNVKEGSIVEYEYKLTSDFLFNFQPWYFQGEIPHLWSEYTASLPQFFKYMLVGEIYRPFYLRDSKDKKGNFSVDVKRNGSGPFTLAQSERIDIICGVTDFRWAMKDVPSLKAEAFTSSMENYLAKLEFQLAAYLEPLEPETIMSTWPDLTKKLLSRKDFGVAIEDAMSWLPGELNAILQNASTETEKARKIYSYLRDNFTCTDYHQRFTDRPLQEVYKKKNGNVAEINLLLTAMLRYAGLNVDPVILSRRDYGFVYAKYPVLGRFNYVISKAIVDGKEIMLDATRSKLGFGKLHYDCYNGLAKIVDEKATDIFLTSDKLTEKEVVTVNFSADAKGNWNGSISKLYGYYQSASVRNKITTSDNTAFAKELSKEFGNDVKLENLVIDSLTKLEEPVTVRYDVRYSNEMEDIVYVNPFIVAGYKQNPFKSADRQYPVDMPYKVNEIYYFSFTIPEGYEVDEIPKPVTLKMNNRGDAVFVYDISRPGSNIVKLACRLEVNKTVFQTEEYNSLREFFNQLVAKQNEQLVLKKKK